MVTEGTTDAEGKAVMAGLLYGTYFAPGNRRLWVQTRSGENELSEKQAVLGTNAKQ